MKVCRHCNLRVAGSRRFCPLCQQELEAIEGGGSEKSKGVHIAPIPEEEVFPEIPTVYRRYHLFFRILIFASIVAAVVSVGINLLVPARTWWSLFVVGGIVCMWLSLAVAFHKRCNILKSMLYQVVLVSGLCVLWDVCTGWHGWSVDFVVPIVCTAVLLSMSVTVKVMNLKFEDYVIYLVLDIVFGIVPIVFLLTGLLTVLIPSILCICCSVISFAAIAVFEGKRLREELVRRLHV